MTDQHLAADLNDWLQREVTAEPIVCRLDELMPAQWKEFVADYCVALRVEIAKKLIARAHWLLAVAPRDAVPVSRLAIKFARFVVGSTDEERDAAVDLQADAWREHANALLFIEDFENARAAADEATFLYSLVVTDQNTVPADDDGSLRRLILALMPAANVGDAAKERLKKAAIHGLILGQILAGQGYVDEGLTLIEQSTNVLLSCCQENKAYVQGRTIYAKILGERRRYGEALDVLEATAAVAKDLHDEATLAHLVNNIGYLHYYHFGNVPKARACLEIALQMFEDLGLKAHALRPRTILAALLMEEGTKPAINRAISELFKSRAAYLENGLTNDAAKVMLKIIRGFILARRQADINWPEISRTFEGAGLRPDSLRALHHLEQVASSATLTIADVEDAENILRLSIEGSSKAVQEAG